MTWRHAHTDEVTLREHVARLNLSAYGVLALGAVLFYAGELSRIIMFLAILWATDAGEKNRRSRAKDILSQA